MSQAIIALEPNSAASSKLRTVLNSRYKLDELSLNVLDDYRADIFRLAEGQLTTTGAGNIDNFCNVWTQAQERYKTRSAAIATYKSALASTTDLYIRDHKDDLLSELRALVSKCDAELQQQTQLNEGIAKQKAIYEQWITNIESYDVDKRLNTDGTDRYARAPRKAARKRSKRKPR